MDWIKVNVFSDGKKCLTVVNKAWITRVTCRDGRAEINTIGETEPIITTASFAKIEAALREETQ
jgi:hypothetical protein